MRSTLRRLGTALVTVALLTSMAVLAHAQSGAWLGVVTQDVDEDLRQSLDLRDDGVLVSRVLENSPAERAGIRKGDVIVRFEGQDVTSPAQLAQLVGDQDDGDRVSVVIWRDGSRRELSARLAGRSDRIAPEPPSPPTAPRAPRVPRAPRAPAEPERDVKIRAFRNGQPIPEDEARRLLKDFHIDGDGKAEIEIETDDDHDSKSGDDKRHRIQIRRFGDGDGVAPRAFELRGLEGLQGLQGLSGVMGRGRLGVRTEELTPDLASALGAEGSKGVLVVEVLGGTAAEKAGLKAGDVITDVNDKAVYDASDLRNALPKDGGRTTLSVIRRGSRRTIEADVDAVPRTMTWRDGGSLGQGRGGDDHVKVFRNRLTPGTSRDEAELRDELKDLREQLRELREQLEGMKR